MTVTSSTYDHEVALTWNMTALDSWSPKLYRNEPAAGHAWFEARPDPSEAGACDPPLRAAPGHCREATPSDFPAFTVTVAFTTADPEPGLAPATYVLYASSRESAQAVALAHHAAAYGLDIRTDCVTVATDPRLTFDGVPTQDTELPRGSATDLRIPIRSI